MTYLAHLAGGGGDLAPPLAGRPGSIALQFILQLL